MNPQIIAPCTGRSIKEIEGLFMEPITFKGLAGGATTQDRRSSAPLDQGAGLPAPSPLTRAVSTSRSSAKAESAHGNFNREHNPQPASWCTPTVLAGVTPEMRIAREEILA
jgi:hypothetical protein